MHPEGQAKLVFHMIVAMSVSTTPVETENQRKTRKGGSNPAQMSGETFPYICSKNKALKFQCSTVDNRSITMQYISPAFHEHILRETAPERVEKYAGCSTPRRHPTGKVHKRRRFLFPARIVKSGGNFRHLFKWRIAVFGGFLTAMTTTTEGCWFLELFAPRKRWFKVGH